MDEEAYKNSLLEKPVADLATELQKVINDIDILFTLHNSLDDKDLTEGGGPPEAQAQYQELVMHQRCINLEINKRHMLDMLK